MKYLVCVLNHYSREISQKVQYLNSQKIPFKVFTDFTEYRKKKDTRWLGLVINYLNILKYESDAEWKIIIHDDIDFDHNLFDKITHILKFAPKNIISFYNPTNKAYTDCYKSGKHIFRTYSNWWSQCHAFPKNLEKDYISWAENNPDYVKKYAEDGLLQRYLSCYNIPLYAVVPSLIQHTGYNESTFNLPARVGKNLRNSATHDPDFDVKFINWNYEFRYPYINNEKKRFDK